MTAARPSDTERRRRESAERERRIIDVLMSLGEGEVTTYGDVAEVAGYPRQARLVGRILATTDEDVPWWRVVNASGMIRTTNPKIQAGLLAEEDVLVQYGKVLRAPIGRFSHSAPLGRFTPCVGSESETFGPDE